MFAETKRFENEFIIHVSTFLDVFTPCKNYMSKILLNYCDVVSNPSFCTFTWNDASYSVFEAKMNSDISLQTTALFFFSIELLSETGYWLGVCHIWFHLHGLPQAARSGSENYKMKKFSCPQRDLNSRPLDGEAYVVTFRQWGLTRYQRVKTLPDFSCANYTSS